MGPAPGAKVGTSRIRARARITAACDWPRSTLSTAPVADTLPASTVTRVWEALSTTTTKVVPSTEIKAAGD